MNLVLTFCWREWRAQRAVLAGYTALALASLCLVFLLVPESWWLDGRGALALSWFVAAGCIGVLAFAVPALVRSEFGAKDDQFVRRLPDALVPSFAGKLLFLVLVAMALPLLCLLAGEGFLLAIDRGWDDLFPWEHNGVVTLRWPWPVVACAYAALAATWVWAVGTWLPGGRMAIGGTILLALLLGLVVFAVLRQSPGIEHGIAWRDWLWTVPVTGLLAAFVAWTVGRRGGGPWRSARFGLAAAACGFLPPGAWLGERAWDFHHPDPQRLANLETWGLTPDLRFALVTGAAHESYLGRVPFRVDLADGSARQLAGIRVALSPEVRRPSVLGLQARSRWWGCYEHDAWADRLTRYRVLDLATGAWVASSTGTAKATPSELRREAVAQLPPEPARAAFGALLQAPDGVVVWFDGHDLCFAVGPDRVERVRWEGDLPTTVRPMGHGFQGYGARRVVFDLAARRAVPEHHLERLADGAGAWLVRGTLLLARRDRPGQWLRLDPGAASPVPIPVLAGADVLGLLDDDRVLCRRPRPHDAELFVWTPANETVMRLAVPAGAAPTRRLGVLAPLRQYGSLLPRDPAGRVLLAHLAPGTTTLLWLDPDTLQVERLHYRPDDGGAFRLLAWLDAATWLVQDRRGIQRVDLATGAATQLFPRPEAAPR